MQVLFLDIFMLIIFAIGVGILSSMIGIGGGTVNTPLLLILFGFTAQEAPATALVGGLFVSIAASVSYMRQDPRPTIPKIGIILAILTVPGSLFGVFLRTLVTDDYALRVIFGIFLFPVAIKMLFAAKRGKSDLATELANWDMSHISRRQMAISLLGAFIGGISAGLLGLGGGAVIVPVLCILMGLPMHAAVATSMFTMMFTAASGTAYNIILGHINLYFAIALGIGMLVGGQIGARLACRVNSVQLKRIFGLIIILPLISMMRLGQLWLDPSGSRGVLSTMGDIIIWLAIVIPIGILRYYQIKNQPSSDESVEPCDLPTS
jgi:uncharacterized membrane protein YfcA